MAYALCNNTDVFARFASSRVYRCEKRNEEMKYPHKRSGLNRLNSSRMPETLSNEGLEFRTNFIPIPRVADRVSGI